MEQWQLGNYDPYKQNIRDNQSLMQQRADEFRASQGLPPLYSNSGQNTLGGFIDANSSRGSSGAAMNYGGASSTNPLLTEDFNQARALLTKYLSTSAQDTPNRFESSLNKSESRVNSLLDNPDSIQQSAAYKFRMGQGLEGVNRSLAAKGMLGSGNRLAALNDYAQGQASQEYDNQYNRLASLLGQNTQAYLGDKNANISAWGQRAGALGSYYQGSANNMLQDQQQNNSNRLGWASLSQRANEADNADRLGWASVYQRGFPTGSTRGGFNTSSADFYNPNKGIGAL